MHIPINDRDTINAEGLLRMTGRDRGIVEKTKTHRGRVFRMMAGRTNGGESILRFAR